MFKKKVLSFLLAAGLFVFAKCSVPVFGVYYSDVAATRSLKGANSQEVGKLLTYKEFKSDDRWECLNSKNLRILNCFDGVNKLKLDFLKNGTQTVFLTKFVERNANGDFETVVNKMESPYKNDKDFFEHLRENHKKESNGDSEKLKKAANLDSLFIINVYNAETNEFLASVGTDVFHDFLDFKMKDLKYRTCYTMDGWATEARFQVDATGLEGELFPEGPTERAGVDCSDFVKLSGLRGQERVKLKYYDVVSGKLVCEKVAELKHYENNDNIQFNMRDEKGQPLVVGKKQYRVVVTDMNDKELCWFKYVVGEPVAEQSW